MTLGDDPSLGSSGTAEWQRLDPRMLFVHPVTELRRFVVPLVGVLLLGATQGGGALAGVAAIGIPVAIGVVRYLTTSYRIADGRIELQRGLLNRQRLSTPLDRVRTVDLTASVVHRLLRLSTVGIGTGTAGTDGSDRLELDALATSDAVLLRDRLLARAATRAGVPGDGGEVRPPRTEPLVAFSPRWLWYAPFSSAGLVVVGGLLGGLGQLAGESDVDLRLDERIAAPSGVLIAAAVVALLLAALAITVLGYLVTNGGLTLTRQPGSWHLRRGLLTTRETSIDVERVAGVTIGEPAALRLARGARLSAIVTGLDRTDRGSEVLVPPTPAAVARTAAAAVLGTATPIGSALVGHGPAATRRRYVRALLPAAAIAAAVALAVLAGLSPWLLSMAALPFAVALALAADRARSLGHALTTQPPPPAATAQLEEVAQQPLPPLVEEVAQRPSRDPASSSSRHLVARSGSLLRRRDILDCEHVIGWTFRDTWFQRRAGLTTLDATTAGGRGRVTVLDLPAADAVALADDARPGLVDQFR